MYEPGIYPLPLQHEPRQQGNSIFVDERFEAYPDQWAFLASVSRIDVNVAEGIAREATRTGKVVGVRFAETLDDEVAVAPWTRLPSGSRPAKGIAEPLPLKNSAASQETERNLPHLAQVLHQIVRLRRTLAALALLRAGSQQFKVVQIERLRALFAAGRAKPPPGMRGAEQFDRRML